MALKTTSWSQVLGMPSSFINSTLESIFNGLGLERTSQLVSFSGFLNISDSEDEIPTRILKSQSSSSDLVHCPPVTKQASSLHSGHGGMLFTPSDDPGQQQQQQHISTSLASDPLDHDITSSLSAPIGNPDNTEPVLHSTPVCRQGSISEDSPDFHSTSLQPTTVTTPLKLNSPGLSAIQQHSSYQTPQTGFLEEHSIVTCMIEALQGEISHLRDQLAKAWNKIEALEKGPVQKNEIVTNDFCGQTEEAVSPTSQPSQNGSRTADMSTQTEQSEASTSTADASTQANKGDLRGDQTAHDFQAQADEIEILSEILTHVTPAEHVPNYSQPDTMTTSLASIKDTTEGPSKPKSSKITSKPPELLTYAPIHQLLIGDSELKHVRPNMLVNTDVRCIRGATTSRLMAEVHTLDLTKYHTIIIHVGTNELDQDPQIFHENYDRLVSKICQSYTGKIIISGICPRDDKFKDIVELHNMQLRILCLQRIMDTQFCENMTHLCSYYEDGVSIPTYVADQTILERDGYHLNKKGSQLLLESINLVTRFLPRCKSHTPVVNPPSDATTTDRDWEARQSSFNSAPITVRSQETCQFAENQQQIQVVTGFRPSLKLQSRGTTVNSVSNYRKACHFCGERNHMKKDCKHGHPILCNRCHCPGHKQKMCHLYNEV